MKSYYVTSALLDASGIVMSLKICTALLQHLKKNVLYRGLSKSYVNTIKNLLNNTLFLEQIFFTLCKKNITWKMRSLSAWFAFIQSSLVKMEIIVSERKQ